MEVFFIKKNIVNIDKLKKLMKENNVSVAILAQETGYTEASISKILNSKIKNPSVGVLSKIAKILGVKLSEIVFIDQGDDFKC